MDDRGDDDGVCFADEAADAGHEWYELLGRPFDAAFWEDADDTGVWRGFAWAVCASCAEVSDCFDGRAGVGCAVACDGDDAEPAPESLCAFELHVGGHHPADEPWEDGLHEQWVDAGGVVAGEDDGAVVREVVEVLSALDAEAVDESGVGADDEPDDVAGAFACWALAGGAEDEGGGGDGEEEGGGEGDGDDCGG